mmetsp:Transcript_90999/g.262343  ORF Transcript_90999/g.262343 Transcript_90999/m.262343 type:complete len:335 (+) Transcript_90999:322-1326(+)
MVAGRLLKVDLVRSEDVESVFKEHRHHGKFYVEVEPDAEYFIRVQAVDAAPSQASSDGWYRIKIKVDDKSLPWEKTISHQDLFENAHCFGASSHVDGNGQRSFLALKFVKPTVEKVDEGRGTQVNASELIGKIRIDLFDIEFYNETRKRAPRGSEEESPSASNQSAEGPTDALNVNKRVLLSATIQSDFDPELLREKKILRSAVGKTRIPVSPREWWPDAQRPTLATTSPTSLSLNKKSRLGELLESITLNYCSTAVLVAAGILQGGIGQSGSSQATRQDPGSANSPHDETSAKSQRRPKTRPIEVDGWMYVPRELVDMTAESDDEQEEQEGGE